MDTGTLAIIGTAINVIVFLIGGFKMAAKFSAVFTRIEMSIKHIVEDLDKIVKRVEEGEKERQTLGRDVAVLKSKIGDE